MPELYGSRQLSLHEMDIVRRVAAGMKNSEIAGAMGSTENMIKNYLRIIFDKTGMNSRLELALWYVSHPELKPKARAKAAGR